MTCVQSVILVLKFAEIGPKTCITDQTIEDIVTESVSVNVVDDDPDHTDSINRLRNKVNAKTFNKFNKINR